MTACADLPGLWAVPATIDLAGAEIELVSVVAREQRLARAINAHPLVGTAAGVGDERFDYVFVDCPPSLGLLTVNALSAARDVIVPVQREYLALEGLGQLMVTFDLVRRNLNPRLQLRGMLLTMFDRRTALADQVADEVRKHFPETFDTSIPRSVRLGEAPSHGLPIALYRPDSKGAEAYRQLADEFRARRGGRAVARSTDAYAGATA